MAEWLILLLLVPTVVAPAVVLLGFVGCYDPDVDEAAFEPSFELNLLPGPSDNAALFGNEGQWEGKCLVQRIEPSRLSRSGMQIKLTLRASSTSDASIDRIYISQPDPGLTSDPYDSAIDLTEISSVPLIVHANDPAIVGPVNYNLDRDQPLLIAIDFSAAPASAISYTDQVIPEEVVAYSRRGAEAGQRDRAVNYVVHDNRLYLIEKIEVR